ncbi:MAG: catalase/peroxidase HPI [Halobacteriovoraceae bacterium]|nr:catalase/peroxidase HPI [Halobacteriovoraceae bacterium]
MRTILNLCVFALVTVACSTNSTDKSGKGQGRLVTEENKNAPVKYEAKPNSFWWPDNVNLAPLRTNLKESSPYGDDFDYAKEFSKLDLAKVKKDIEAVMTDSQDWWPADWGHYGPFFIRMAWHSAGTYRTVDGRGGAAGGQLRFEPLNSWPDNANLDKARRLLWPIKKKYGRALSWADLMVLTGNVAMESMGFKTVGFAGGREDDWEAELVYWGPEAEMMGAERFHGKRKLDKPLGATHMGLIYVNPEGPNGDPDPKKAAHDIRETFQRMAMNDEETAALIAGGHTFGKVHGAHKVDDCVGVEPAAGDLEQQGFGWKNKCGKGNAEDTITSGLEGAWTAQPTKWTHQYLSNLYGFEWELEKSPSGAKQWVPKDGKAKDLVPDAHIEDKRNPPVMLTTDLSLKEDPEFRKITKRWLENPKEFEKAFAMAWFKLTHRDMGPKSRYVGKEVPDFSLPWQDPVPTRSHKLITKAQVNELKNKILNSGLTIPELVKTAWASAATYRATDMRGGANGARVRLAPQNTWKANDPKELKKVLDKLTEIQSDYNKGLTGGRQVSLADTIVIGGAAAIEAAAKKGGMKISVPVTLGRTDASQKNTDVESFEVLKPVADGFRNYFDKESKRSPVHMLVDKADTLDLTVPEMTVLVGGMRSIGANSGNTKHGVFTKRPGALTNDFFTNLLDMSVEWTKSKDEEGVYVGKDRKSGKVMWTATPVDLLFGSHAELRAVAEAYAANDAKKMFTQDFVNAWSKVMNAGRFDI